MSAAPRLAIVITHPIQHFTHLYRALALEPGLQLKVFFCSRIGLDKYYDPEMRTEIAWAGDLTGGYPHEFLSEATAIRQSSTFGINNPSVVSALSRFRPDAVMLYGYATITGLRALSWCRFKGVPVIMTGDGEFGRQRSVVRSLVRQAAVRAIFSQVAAFLTVGDQNEAMLAQAGVSRSRMVRAPFPIDEAAYLTARANRARLRAEVRVRLGIPLDAVVALFVGKLATRKRPRDLIEAFARRNSAGRAGLLHILYCGNGEERGALEALAKTHGVPVTFAGFVNVDRLPDHYCASDILVHPSQHDPHPLICSEAACIGLPMILSDKVGAIGPTDVARAGENAVVIPCGDVAALATALAGLCASPALLAAMASASIAAYADCTMAASVRGVRRAVELVATGRRPKAGALTPAERV